MKIYRYTEEHTNFRNPNNHIISVYKFKLTKVQNKHKYITFNIVLTNTLENTNWRQPIIILKAAK